MNGVAENKAGMSLVVIYDVSGCPTDKSMSTVDFKKLGQDECFSNFIRCFRRFVRRIRRRRILILILVWREGRI